MEVDISIYLYLSLYPESLIASMLPPDEFGRYLAVGIKKKESMQEAVFFELDKSQCEKVFDLSDVETRCVAHPDGEPKNTAYYSIYRFLERIPFDAFKDLYLSTRYGEVLRISREKTIPAFS